MPWTCARIVVAPSVRSLCRQEYPGHKKGCPNWNKKHGCPPTAPLINKTLDLSQPTFVIWNAFDLATHIQKRKEKHPEYSWRQLVNCLYWQPSARKVLKGIVIQFLREHRGLHAVSCPEAQGVNVTETMRGIGIELEWPPKTIAYQVVVAGTRNSNRS